VIFTGGIGENSAAVRARIVERLAVLGLELDPAVNDGHGGIVDGVVHRGRISPFGARPLVLVVRTDEEYLIARDTADLL
jgi:acetate kinase